MARIGLLEDNVRIAKLCVTMLTYAGHDVISYADAQECLQNLSVFDPYQLPPLVPSKDGSPFIPLPIDVLILDLHLPTVSGLEIVHLLHHHPQTCLLPLIFCTAAPHTEIERALQIAPDATLVEKPFKLQTLISAIATALAPANQAM